MLAGISLLTRINLLVTLLGNVTQLVALVATVHIHLALTGIVTHTVTLVALLCHEQHMINTEHCRY